MEKLPNGVVTIVNLPGSGSLISRSWKIYTHHFGPLMAFALLMALGTVVNGDLRRFSITWSATDLMRPAP